MAWPGSIDSSRTEKRRPVSQGLTDDIRLALDALAMQTLASDCSERLDIAMATSDWITFKKGPIYIPSWAVTLEAIVECYVDDPKCSGRVRVYSSGGSDTATSTFTPPNGTAYANRKVTINSVPEAGHWNVFDIQLYQSSASATVDGAVRGFSMGVKTIT